MAYMYNLSVEASTSRAQGQWPITVFSCYLCGHRQPQIDYLSGASNASALQSAIAMRHLVQILLVIGFGIVKFLSQLDFGGDFAVPGGCQSLLIAMCRLHYLVKLAFVRCKNS